MKNRRLALKQVLLVGFFLFFQACGPAAGQLPTTTPLPPATLAPTQTPAPTDTPIPAATLTQTATQVPTATLTPTKPAALVLYIPPACQGQPIATLPAATEMAEPTLGAAVNQPISKTTQLNMLNSLDNLVRKVYLYPDYNGVDWAELVTKTRDDVNNGLDSEAFYGAMSQMIAALGDEHSNFQSPTQVAASKAELAGSNQYVGIGVVALPLLDKGRVAVIATFPGSSAELSGIKPHDSLLAVDGLALADGQKFYGQRLRGPACSAAVVTVQSPGQAPRDVTIIRAPVSAPEPVLAQLVQTADGSRIGYIFLPTFYDKTIPGQVKQALEGFGTLDGLILDNRMNGGGASEVLEPVLSYFSAGVLGNFVSRTATRALKITANPVANSQEVPLVVLVGKDTVSFGEIFAGVLQDSGRAKVVGQTSQGNVEILHGYNFRDGSQVWLAQESFDPAQSHAKWEHHGIQPDVEAFADWDTFTFETDPGVAAALKLLGHQ